MPHGSRLALLEALLDSSDENAAPPIEAPLDPSDENVAPANATASPRKPTLGSTADDACASAERVLAALTVSFDQSGLEAQRQMLAHRRRAVRSATTAALRLQPRQRRALRIAARQLDQGQRATAQLASLRDRWGEGVLVASLPAAPRAATVSLSSASSDERGGLDELLRTVATLQAPLGLAALHATRRQLLRAVQAWGGARRAGRGELKPRLRAAWSFWRRGQASEGTAGEEAAGGRVQTRSAVCAFFARALAARSRDSHMRALLLRWRARSRAGRRREGRRAPGHLPPSPSSSLPPPSASQPQPQPPLSPPPLPPLELGRAMQPPPRAPDAEGEPRAAGADAGAKVDHRRSAALASLSFASPRPPDAATTYHAGGCTIGAAHGTDEERLARRFRDVPDSTRRFVRSLDAFRSRVIRVPSG